MQSGQTQNVTRAAGCQKRNSVWEKTLMLDFPVISFWTYRIMLSSQNKLLPRGKIKSSAHETPETSASAEMVLPFSLLFFFSALGQSRYVIGSVGVGHAAFLWHVLAPE